MITYKICLIVLLFTTGVLCRNTGRGRTRHRQPDEAYKYNHPPEPENYEAIPVAVVYEEDSNRNDKSIKSDVSTKNNVEQVNKEKPNEPTSTLEPIEDEKRNDNVDNYPVGVQFTDDNSKDKEQDKPASTFAPKSEKEQQIPVAVVYEPEASYYNEPRPKTQRVSNKRRKIQRRPPAQVEQTVESKEPEINAKEAVSTQDVLVPETPNVQEQFSSREKNIPTPNEREPVTQEPINYNYHKTIFRPTSNFRVSDKEEQLSNSEQSIPDQGFAKRDNLTRHREVVPIVQSENLVFSHTGDFQYSYEGGDGTKAFESGKLKTFEDDNTGEAVSGGFSYTAKDGNEYSLSYTADENGYQPVGAHLPTPPPIPPAIARALAYLATKPTPEPVTESSYEADYS